MMQAKISEILQQLKLPIIAAPMYIASTPELVIAQCKAGIIGSFPALNARPQNVLNDWLLEIKKALVGSEIPFAVNQIIHQSNTRLEHDLNLCIEHQVPIIITSLRAPPRELLDALHAYGGLVFHDVINVRHAQKAIAAGVDGLILVAAGAGGHGGSLSPFAFVQEVRQFFKGPLALAGAITNGSSILAAQVLGADFAYIGSLWLATKEANISAEYKQMICQSSAADVIYTPYFSGVHGNFLKQSIINAGLDPDNLPTADKSKMNFSDSEKNAEIKAWRDIWSAGQGIGMIDQINTVSESVEKLAEQYQAAKKNAQ